jgi:glycolate oxidase FAD binding subunit
MHGIGDMTQQPAAQQATRLRQQQGVSGARVAGEVLDTRAHRGIVSYDPTELVITARAARRCANCRGAGRGRADAAVRAAGLRRSATVGGMVASGLSGPRRPWAGSVRDFVLGTRVITGHGKLCALVAR